MMNVNKKELKEQEIRTMFITPALKAKGWEVMKNMREEYYFFESSNYRKKTHPLTPKNYD